MRKGLFGRLEEELEARNTSAGLSMLDVLDLPDSVRGLLNWLMRQHEVASSDISAYLDGDEAQARSMLDTLMERGLVRQIEAAEGQRYRVVMSAKRTRTLSSDIWQSLDKKLGG